MRNRARLLPLVPAQAGTHYCQTLTQLQKWVPAFAGTSGDWSCRAKKTPRRAAQAAPEELRLRQLDPLGYWVAARELISQPPGDLDDHRRFHGEAPALERGWEPVGVFEQTAGVIEAAV